MSWICTKCGLTNVNVNTFCADSRCKNERGEFEPFDSFDELLSEIRLSKIDKIINFYPVNLLSERSERRMTPQEQLFSDLFNHEKILVKDMDTLSLRAHREKLAQIAFEARAKLTAVDDEEKDRRKIANSNKPQGFARSLNTDEATTNAINAVKERQKRMSKADKIQAGLEKLGISSTDAAKLMSAGTILGRVKSTASKITEAVTDSKPIFNPFEKK